MIKKEYLEHVESTPMDNSKIKLIEKKYGCITNNTVKKIISYSESNVFIGEEVRALSFSEIVTASDDLHVNFQEYSYLPLFDCMDNDFIVFIYSEGAWAKFNIIEKVAFFKGKELSQLLG